jgi:hypothetical protein
MSCGALATPDARRSRRQANQVPRWSCRAEPERHPGFVTVSFIRRNKMLFRWNEIKFVSWLLCKPLVLYKPS